MKHKLAILIITLTVTLAYAQSTGVRIKDIATVAGARDNQLVGYGLVVGLAGDGDKNPVYTLQSIANMLQRFGITVPSTTLQAKNVAAVLVTADIPAFMKSGMRLDVQVASLGDAKSLQGGVLLQTPLFGADGKVYAVAQGPVSVGGFSAGQGGTSVTKNHPTSGQIVNGAIVEREIPADILNEGFVQLILREPDFTSSARLASAINKQFEGLAEALDSSTIKVKVPPEYKKSVVDFVAALESIEVIPDTPARIIINEKTGTIVANSKIHISNCAISHGNLVINIATTFDVSQPQPLSQTGTTVVTPKTEVKATEPKGTMIALPELPTVEKVAAALNSLGVTPRDMMAIFQAMKQAGALQAELILK